MHQNVGPDVQSEILDTVKKLAEATSASDSSRSELKRSLASVQNQLAIIQRETSAQTTQLENLETTLDAHIMELDTFKKEVQSNFDSMKADTKETKDQVREVRSDLQDHMHIETAEIVNINEGVKTYTAKLDDVLSAFPHQDNKPMLREHRSGHEEELKVKLAWERRRDKVTEHLLTGGIWAAVLFIAMAVWEAVKLKVMS